MSLITKSFTNFTHEWCRSLTAKERKELEFFHMGGIYGVKGVYLDIDFIHTALEYWDMDTHCFRLAEEFSAILGFPALDLAVIPRINEYCYKDFERFFNLRENLHATTLIDLILKEFARFFN